MLIYLPMTADLFHIGHLRAIKQCAKYGEVIIGLLDCPEYKKAIIPYNNRKEILEALSFVKMVVRQDSLNCSKNLEKFKPDFVASGDGFEKEELEAIKKNGSCKALNISYYKGENTTKIKERVLELYK